MTAKLPISAYIICQDEEAVIENCLKHVAMCAEIIVVDSGSADRTLEIVRALAADGMPIRLIEEPWRGYAAQKQFALDQCTQDWCLNVDADERASPMLHAALPDLIAATSKAYAFKRYEYLIGYGWVLPRQGAHYSTRLFRRGTGAYKPEEIVHEGVYTSDPVEKWVDGGLLHFKGLMFDALISKDNTYSTLKARMKKDAGAPARPLRMLLSPVAAFLRNYVHYGFWRNGWAGFILARKAAITTFLTEAKRWELDAIDRVPVEETDVDGRY